MPRSTQLMWTKNGGGEHGSNSSMGIHRSPGTVRTGLVFSAMATVRHPFGRMDAHDRTLCDHSSAGRDGRLRQAPPRSLPSPVFPWLLVSGRLGTPSLLHGPPRLPAVAFLRHRRLSRSEKGPAHLRDRLSCR